MVFFISFVSSILQFFFRCAKRGKQRDTQLCTSAFYITSYLMGKKLIQIVYFQVSNALQQRLFLEDKVQLTVVTPLYPTLRAAEKIIILRYVLMHVLHSTKNGHYGSVINTAGKFCRLQVAGHGLQVETTCLFELKSYKAQYKG